MGDMRRVEPPEQYDGRGGVIEKLWQDGPFESKQAVMVFAAAVGWASGASEKEFKRGEGVRWSIFQGSQQDAFVHAIAVAESGGIEVLGRQEEKERDAISAFERYAAAGLKILAREVVEAPIDMLDAVLAMIARASKAAGKGGTRLKGLSVDDLEFLGADG
jgi:dnd system-associated protein 4